MSNRYVFPNFHFFPKELNEEVKSLAKKYKQADKISENLTRVKLPKLLAEIRALADDRDEIIRFAKKLKKLDINILATEYPYEKENKSTTRKIIIILQERYYRIVGRRFWIHFLLNPYDPYIINILNFAFTNENENFLGLQPSIRDKYQKLFSQSSSLIVNMAIEIANEKRKIYESFADWKIKLESRLAFELWLTILELFINEEWFINIQGTNLIEEKLENLPFETYKKIINNYLTHFDFTEYHSNLLRQVINRMGDPRDNLHRWNGISDETINKVKTWLFKQELFNFLDYDRFNYWEQYLRKVNDINMITDPPVAAMYFNNFVVLEFANIGNAAYFYEVDGFKKHIEPRLKTFIPESYLKDRHADYFINKLNHAGHWHSRFDDYMIHYFNGHFWYRH
ncbi:EH signature domain-containing protein [Niallia sp. Krafla_26]|uniref:EH signature domain-containing protein n=1 Tax=Niallia sp. Krafla_26 TaxID=3064703 RepID=UPI003D186EE7